MKKRLIGIVVCLSMLIPCVSAYADYTPGATFQTVISEPTALSKDTEEIFNIVLDFDAASMTVGYEASSNAVLRVETDRGESSATLSAEAAETQILLKPELRYGENTIKLCANDDIIINSLTFNKVNYYPISKQLKHVVDYTPYEKAMEDVVVVALNNSCLKVDGALRYVDYNNTDNGARLLDGKIYLPVKAFADAFSLYSEDYNDNNNYVYLSDDNFSLYCSSHNGSYYIRDGIKTSVKNPVVYINSVAYLPVRYIAELMGMAVEYSDGLAIIGKRTDVGNIIDDPSLLSQLSEEMRAFSFSERSSGRTYYVSEKYGNDGNSGTIDAPFASISKAANEATAGDTVIIAEGIYREAVTPKNSGTAGAPVIYRAEENADVVISAMETISGFEKYRDNIYVADIPKSLGAGRNFVAIDNEAVIEGRHPNVDTGIKARFYETEDTDFQRKLYPTVGDLILTEKDTGANRFTLESTSDLNRETENFWKGATVVAMYSSGWTLSTGEVMESSNGKIIVQPTAATSYGFSSYQKEPFETDYGFLTNHINTLDSPGEWYIDGEESKIYMIPPASVAGENLEIELKQRQTLIDLSGKNYIQFKNINTFGGGITMKDSQMCVINGGEHKYISHFTLNTSPHVGALGTTNTDPEGPQTKGEVGEYISGKNNAFVNAVIDGSAGAGIYTAGAYSYIDNNIVLNTDYAGIFPSGITIEGERWNIENIVRGGHTVTHNTVKYAGRGCLYNSLNSRELDGKTSVFPTVANNIGYNEFGRGCLVSRDGGVVYEHGIVAGNDTKQSTLHHNIVYDNVMQRAAEDYTLFAGVYRDAHSVFEKCYSNIYFNTDNDPDFAGKIEDMRVAFYTYTTTTGPSLTENYNNIFLGFRAYGQDGFTVGDYPGGKMFSAGAQSKNRFLYNIEETALKKTVLAEDFVLENGAGMENGMIKLPNTGDALVADNINCTSGAKRIKLSFTNDKYDFGIYCFDIDVIKDGRVIYTDSEYISCGGSELDDVCEKVFYIPENVDTGADFSIRIRAKDKNSVQFQKLVIDDYAGEIPAPKFPKGSKIIPAGTAYNFTGNTDQLVFNRKIDQTEEFRNNAVSKIGNTTLYYDVDTNRVNAVQVMVAVSLNYSYGTLSVYADNDTAPLCTVDMENMYKDTYPDDTAWNRLNVRAEFNRELSAGRHIIRIEFKKKKNNQYFTPDFYNFALYNTENQ